MNERKSKGGRESWREKEKEFVYVATHWHAKFAPRNRNDINAAAAAHLQVVSGNI